MRDWYGLISSQVSLVFDLQYVFDCPKETPVLCTEILFLWPQSIEVPHGVVAGRAWGIGPWIWRLTATPTGRSGQGVSVGTGSFQHVTTFDNFTSEDSHIFSLFPQLFNRKLSQSKDLLPCQEAGGTSAEDRRTPSDRATIVVTCCHTRVIGPWHDSQSLHDVGTNTDRNCFQHPSEWRTGRSAVSKYWTSFLEWEDGRAVLRGKWCFGWRRRSGCAAGIGATTAP